MTAIRREAWCWIPPDDVIHAADSAPTRYDRAPLAREVPRQYRGATRTQMPLTPGIVTVRNYFKEQFSISQTYMPGRSRPMMDAQRLDMHQAGRACDFINNRDVEKGRLVANALLLVAADIGLQYIVHAGNRWDAGAPPGRRFAGYEGSHMHKDHPHAELNLSGARGETPWFRNHPLASAVTNTSNGGMSGSSTPLASAHTSEPSAPFSDHEGESARNTWILIGSGLAVAVIGGVFVWRRVA